MSKSAWKDTGWKQLRDDMTEDTEGVKVGFLGAEASRRHIESDSKEPYSIAEIAAVHEYGAPKASIPARPFMHAILGDKAEEKIQLRARGVLAGKYSKNRAHEYLGTWAASELKRKINSNIEPELAPTTIKKKKSSRSLVDTGQMRNSVTYKVIK